MGSILDQLDELAAIPAERPERPTLEIVPRGVRPHANNLLGDVHGYRAPKASAELERIKAIPRRPLESVDTEAMIELMTARLRRARTAPCRCAELGRRCITRLKPVQAWALFEISIVGGLLGPIGVGAGKSGLDILAPMVMPGGVSSVALLVPPTLVEQIVREYHLWFEHWRVPSLIFKDKHWGFNQEGENRPVIHIVPYSRLSRPEATILLLTLKPDLIIADESHRLKNLDTARGARFLNVYKTKPDTALCAWSGSMTDRTIKHYAHLSALALGKNSPLPIDSETLHEWACAIDPPAPGQTPAPMGALADLCEPGESLTNAFKRRLHETRGVVGTDDAGIGASLYMHKRDPGAMPAPIREAIAHVRTAMGAPRRRTADRRFQRRALCSRARRGLLLPLDLPARGTARTDRSLVRGA